MEVQLIGKTTPEILPDWLLDRTLCIVHVNPQPNDKYPLAVPANKWDKSFNAKQVYFYKENSHRRSPFKQNGCLIKVFPHCDSSDGSNVGMFAILIPIHLILICPHYCFKP